MEVKEAKIKKLIEEYEELWCTADEDGGFMRDNRHGQLLYKQTEWLKKTLTNLLND